MTDDSEDIEANNQKLTAYTAQLKGDGAIAQGTNAKAVGKNGILIEGGVNGVGNVIGNYSTSHVTIINSLLTIVKTSPAATHTEVNPNFAADVNILFFRHPDAQLPELQHLIGHHQELLRLSQLYDMALRVGRGSIIFITGQPGYGTKALGRTFVDAIRKGNGRAVLTRFWPEENEKHTRRDPRWGVGFKNKFADNLSKAPEFLNLPEFAPFWPLVFQIWEKCGWGENEALPASPREIPAYLRRFVSPAKPIVILLEDFEYASPAWLELLSYLAPELAQGLPLLFIATLHAEKLAQLIDIESRTPVESLALDLSQKNLAELYHISRVSQESVADYIAPAHADVTEQLAKLANGLPILVQELWEEWRRTNAVVKDKENRWQLDSQIPWQAFGTARDYVRRILEDSWPDVDEAPWSVDKMEEIMTLAAQEGPIFTPDAVALACGVNIKQLIIGMEYLLDEQDDPGLLQLDEPVEIKLETAHWKKNLERWRFSPFLTWYALKGEASSVDKLEKLAESLVQIYWPFVERCASTVAKIYKQAGNNEQSERYLNLIRKDNPLKALMSQGEILLEGTQNEIAFSRLRTISIDLHNLYIESNEPFWAQGFYKQVLMLAEQSNWSYFQADILLLLGGVSHNLREYTEAREYYERSLKLDEELGNKHGISSNLNGLGGVSHNLREYTEAREYYERSLKLDEELGNKHGIAVTLNGLGDVSKQLREYTEAREYFERALKMFEELGDKHFVKKAHDNLTYLSSSEKQEKAE